MSDLKKVEDFEEDRIFFEFLLLEGLERIGKSNDARYLARLKHEFDRMTGKKYVNYFLCNWDFIHDAKTKGISVGPCRGSAGASLAGYCLDITSIDPIENDLLFTRFLSPIRRDAPDIDLDFQDNRRQEVYAYLIEKYGANHCAKVATYARFHPKGILLDVGRIFDIPRSEISKISSLVIERSGGDARASFGLEDTFAEFAEAKEFEKKYPLATEVAKKLEGGIRHKGSHAAAMVVAEHDLNQYAPINKIGGIICLEWEKQLVEDMKLIKFDILGLKTLSVIQDALESAGAELPTNLNDPEVYENVFKNGDTEGCFQFTCLSGDTLIGLNKRKTIKQLFESEFRGTTKSYKDGKLYLNKVIDIKKTGRKKTYKIITKSGKEICASENHRFLLANGEWKMLKDLKIKDKIKTIERKFPKKTLKKIVKRRRETDGYFRSKSSRIMNSKKQKENWRNSVYRKRQSELIKIGVSKDQSFQDRGRKTRKTSEYRKRNSEIKKKFWKDKVASAEQRKKMTAGIRNSKKFSKSIANSNKKRVGAKHPLWKGGILARKYPNFEFQKRFEENFKLKRKESLKRDKYICQRCFLTEKESKKKFGTYLDTHHIKSVRKFLEEGCFDLKKINAVENLQTLCKSCHQKEEHGNKNN